MLARSLGFAASSVYYQLRRLEASDIVVLHRIDHESHYTEKHYDLAPDLRAALSPRRFNELVLSGEPELRRALVSAMCAFGAAQLHTLAETYSRSSPTALDETFFVRHQGAIGCVPARLDDSKAFQGDLMTAVGTHADDLDAKEDPDGLIVFGILPFPTE